MVVGSYLLTTESPWRDGPGFALAPLLDHVQHVLFGEDAFAFQQLYQRRGLPHGGDGQLVEGDGVLWDQTFQPLGLTLRASAGLPSGLPVRARCLSAQGGQVG